MYNRPTINIIKLAEFLTLGCGNHQPTTNGLPECAKEKLAYLKEIEDNKIVSPAKDFFQYASKEALTKHEKTEMLGLLKRLDFVEGDTLSDTQQKGIDGLFMMLDKSSEAFDKLLKEEGLLELNPIIDRILKMI